MAYLTSADLASAERLEELEKAKRAALEQTVKQRDDVSGAIRMGRDGFEKVEDSRERELVALAQQEQAARKEAERRTSMGAAATAAEGVEEGQTPEAAAAISGSPFNRRESMSATPQIERKASSSLPQSPVVKRESVSVDVPTTKLPVKTNFGLTSAWSSDAHEPSSGGVGEQQHDLSLGDQTVLDLSDIVADEPEELDNKDESGEEVKMDLDEEEDQGKLQEAQTTKVEPKPVAWRGSVSSLSHTPVKTVRHDSTLTRLV